MIKPVEFLDFLKGEGFDCFAGVPDSLLKELCACISEGVPADKHTITANEGNAIGVVCGHYLATGKAGVSYMQNSGLGNAINPLLSLADQEVYSLPLLMIIGWRGEPEIPDEPQHKVQGELTLPLLETLRIPYLVLKDDYNLALSSLIKDMQQGNRPVAIIVKQGTFSKYPIAKKPSTASMVREDALRIIIDELDERALVVSTTGKTSRELFEIREQKNQGHERDFLMVGSMGHAFSFAYGLACGTDRTVFCIDGDGAMLMHLGSLPVAVSKGRENLRYIVNYNGVHESVGGQPLTIKSVDLPGLLRAAGFKTVCSASSPGELVQAMGRIKAESLSALILHTAPGSRDNLGRPTSSPKENKLEMMSNLKNC